MKNWGPADYWVIGGAAAWLLGVLFVLLLGWADTASDIAADKPWKHTPWLEDASLWEPYHPTSESTSDERTTE